MFCTAHGRPLQLLQGVSNRYTLTMQTYSYGVPWNPGSYMTLEQMPLNVYKDMIPIDY